jgi:ParB-like nuclease domain
MGLVSAETLARLPTTVTSIASLQPSDSPRLDGLSAEHVRALAEVDTSVPPILVHRATMRVIDGMHRLNAAARRGDDTIEVRFVDGDEHDMFVLAVETNTKHGLPLSLRDRIAAATRITSSHPYWSDRRIAELAGLSPKTIGAVRKRSKEDIPQVAGRVGRDGKERPLNTAHGRQLAGDILAERPGVSVREVARQTGLSLSTVQDVRRRLSQGEDPVPERQRGPRTVVPSARPPADSSASIEPSKVLALVKRDPSLRFSEVGRTILRLLDSHSIPEETWEQLAESVPPHSAVAVASIARRCADAWTRFAEQVESRLSEPYPKVGS